MVNAHDNVVLPEIFPNTKVVSNIDLAFAKAAYPYWPFLDKHQRDDYGLPKASPALAEPTPENVAKFLKWFQNKLSSKNFGAFVKGRYERLVVETCADQGGRTSGNQRPKNIKDVFAIYFGPDFVQRVRSGTKEDRELVFSTAIAWFHQHLYPTKRGWLRAAVEDWMAREGMCAVLAAGDGANAELKKRGHCLEQIARKKATGTILTELAEKEKRMFAASLKLSKLVNDTSTAALDMNKHEILELDSSLTFASGRKSGNRFYVELLDGHPQGSAHARFKSSLERAVSMAREQRVSPSAIVQGLNDMCSAMWLREGALNVPYMGPSSPSAAASNDDDDDEVEDSLQPANTLDSSTEEEDAGTVTSPTTETGKDGDNDSDGTETTRTTLEGNDAKAVEYPNGRFELYLCAKSLDQDCESCDYAIASYFTKKWRDQHSAMKDEEDGQFCLPLCCAECKKRIEDQ
ncbi:hypothetical protein ACHAXT_000409 [Thalassiosira profunda]